MVNFLIETSPAGNHAVFIKAGIHNRFQDDDNNYDHSLQVQLIEGNGH